MYLSGETVSPGYVSEDGEIGGGPENADAFVLVDGRRYYRTRDRLRRPPRKALHNKANSVRVSA